MRRLQGRILGRTIGSVVFALFASACHAPTAPTSTGQPVLSCPASFDASATSADGATVVYPAPTVSGGRASVAVSCSPAAGTQFPTGVTTVACSATDAAAATSTCSFRVNVTRVPELSATRFLAFGDSVTAGEVTVPVTVQSAEGNRQVSANIAGVRQATGQTGHGAAQVLSSAGELAQQSVLLKGKVDRFFADIRAA